MQPKKILLFVLIILTSSMVSICGTNGLEEEQEEHHMPAPSSTLQTNGDGRVVIVLGATGYIGKHAVRESVLRGYTTIAFVRDRKRTLDDDLLASYMQNAQIVEIDVTNRTAVMDQMTAIAATNKIDTIISCLASRTAGKKQVFQIDYQATLNSLDGARAVNARHFILLSAFCVRNPLLELQKAKLQFEQALKDQKDMTWTIVRATAFFKSLSGQVNSVKKGSSFYAFGDGEPAQFNPIAEKDLATYLLDSVTDSSRENQTFNIGGPGGPYTLKKCGKMIYKALGREEEVKYVFIPLWVLNIIIRSFEFLATIIRSESMANTAETARLVRYYATEDMLTTDPSEIFGTTTLQDHYNRVAVEGEVYDPNTHLIAPMLASRKTEEEKEEEL